MRDSTRKWAALALGTVLTTTGCERSEAVDVTPPGSGGEVFLRVVHADRDAGDVSLYAGDRPAAEDLDYLTATGFIALPADQLELRLVPAQGADGRPLATAGATVAAGGRYTVIAFTNAAGESELRVIDDPTGPVPASRAELRVIHLVPNGPRLSVRVLGRSRPILVGLGFGDVRADLVAPLTGTLEFYTAGGDGAPYAMLPNVRFVPGRRYTVVVTGRPDRPDVVHIEDPPN